MSARLLTARKRDAYALDSGEVVFNGDAESATPTPRIIILPAIPEAMTPRPKNLITTALCLLLLLAPAPARAAASKRDVWTRVASKNFTLVGNASEKEIRRVAERLEQFRHAFSRLFAGARVGPGVPVTVVVFKNDEAFKPFKPTHEGKPAGVAGYFAAGPDANFIALTAERRPEDPYAIIFHEYVHLLVRNNMRRVPAWLNEGLAEYYSTFEVTDGNRKVWLGKPIERHVRFLRQQRFIPLRRLLAVDNTSELYDERDRQGVFYAESWALVHYLLFGGGGERRPQLASYIRLMEGGAAGEDAFRQAFRATPEAVEAELKQYVQRNAYSAEVIRFDAGLEFDSEMSAAPLAEAESEAYLGDLLLHAGRLDAAETHLGRALKLDAELAHAHAALGMLRVRQGRAEEAAPHFERAVASGTGNHLAHYYHALSLAGVLGDGERWLVEHTPETTRRIRADLDRAISLAPDFTPAYELLALVNLLAGEQLDESIRLMRRAIAISPGHPEYALTVGRLHARKKDFDAARAVLAPLAADKTAESHIRARAESVLSTIADAERAAREGKAAATDAGGAVGPDEEVSPEPPAAASLRKAAEGERQALGTLFEIECADAGGVSLNISLDDGRTLRLHKGELRRITFVTYTTDVRREITCGPRTPGNRVLVTYRPAPPPDARSETPAPPPPARRPAAGRRGGATVVAAPPAKPDGEVVAVDFIPKDWK